MLPLNRYGVHAFEALLSGGILSRSIVNLAPGGAFVTPWLDVSNYDPVRVCSLANVASAVGGVVMEWSMDGVTVHAAEAPGSALAGVLYDSTNIARRMPFLRVTYTNGAVVQAAFLFVVCGYSGGGGTGGGVPPANVDVQGNIWSLPEPDPSSIEGPLADFPLQGEPDGALRTRAQILTDETAFSDDFPSDAAPTPIARALTGTSAFTAGNVVVIGTGTLYMTEVRVGDYVYRNADTYTAAAQVESIQSNLQLTLVAPYAGAGGATAASSVQNWLVTLVGAAVLPDMFSSYLRAPLPVNNGASITLYRGLTSGQRKGCLPLRHRWRGDIDERRANQPLMIGFIQPVIENAVAYFEMTGAVNTVINCVVASSAVGGGSSYQTVTVTLPNSGTTVTDHLYELLLYADAAVFSIDGVTVATLAFHLPDPYVAMGTFLRFLNTAAMYGVTNLLIDVIASRSLDLLDVHDERVQLELARLNTAVAGGEGPTDATIENHAVNDNLVHSFAQVLVPNVNYLLQIAGGEGICYEIDTAAPGAMQTMPYLLSGQSRRIRTTLPAMIVSLQKRVNGTADATAILVRDDGV